jgi:hypothetical protein
MTSPVDETRTTETDAAPREPSPMTRRQFGAAAGATLLGAIGFGVSRLGGDAPADAATTAKATTTTTVATAATKRTIARTADAATAFMKTLSVAQRTTLAQDYDDDAKTTSWSNFPVTFVERAGLNLSDLSKTERTAAMRVLRALLNSTAYDTVSEIMDGDVFLHEHSSSTEASLGQYYIAFFGKPSSSGAWGLQFGGHHLGINATMNGAEGTITFAPTHLGSQPAVYTRDDGRSVQPLAGMYTTAFAFLSSLSTAQRKALYQRTSLGGMVCAPGSTCSFPTGSGLAGAKLSTKQKRLLMRVIRNWVGLSDTQTTNRELKRIAAKLDDTYVTWSGATTYDMTKGEGISYAISGPNVFIEFACQQGSAGADVDGVITAGWGHIHTIYRDPSNDYAGSVTQQAGFGMGGGGMPGGAPPAGGRSGGA